MFLFLAVGILAAAINTSNNLLLLIFALLAGLLLVSPFLAAWNLAGVCVERHIPERCIEGMEFPVAYEVRQKGRFSRSLIEISEVPHRPGEPRSAMVIRTTSQGAITAPRSMLAGHRGLLELSRLEMATSYPFNLVRLSWTVRKVATLRVAPRFWKLSLPAAGSAGRDVSSVGVPANKAGSSEEFFGVRDVRVGEAPRRIHWRCTARQGKLMRVQEEEMRGGPQALHIDTLGQREGEGFESLVRTAASACFSVLSSGGRLSILWATSGGWQFMDGLQGTAGFNQVLDALAEVAPAPPGERGPLPPNTFAFRSWLQVGSNRPLPSALSGKICVILRVAK